MSAPTAPAVHTSASAEAHEGTSAEAHEGTSAEAHAHASASAEAHIHAHTSAEAHASAHADADVPAHAHLDLDAGTRTLPPGIACASGTTYKYYDSSGDDAPWFRVPAIRYYTNAFIIRENQVLLGFKKRGFGKGKYNGFGGKVEPGETSLQAAVRELQEESGIVAPLAHAGSFLFYTQDADWAFHIDIYTASTYEGDVTETEEMRPEWFTVSPGSAAGGELELVNNRVRDNASASSDASASTLASASTHASTSASTITPATAGGVTSASRDDGVGGDDESEDEDEDDDGDDEDDDSEGEGENNGDDDSENDDDDDDDENEDEKDGTPADARRTQTRPHSESPHPRVPYEHMWETDVIWLPLLFAGKEFIGRADFVQQQQSAAAGAAGAAATDAPRYVPHKWWYGLVLPNGLDVGMQVGEGGAEGGEEDGEEDGEGEE